LLRQRSRGEKVAIKILYRLIACHIILISNQRIMISVLWESFINDSHFAHFIVVFFEFRLNIINEKCNLLYTVRTYRWVKEVISKNLSFFLPTCSEKERFILSLIIIKQVFLILCYHYRRRYIRCSIMIRRNLRFSTRKVELVIISIHQHFC
jgi:hypothetical protein